MSEETFEQPETTPVRTGVAEIDAVVESVAALDPEDVAAHVEVFERAHETLRRGLDAADRS